MDDKEVLMFIHDRLAEVHGENRGAGYMHRLREIAGGTPEGVRTELTYVRKNITDEDYIIDPGDDCDS